MGQEFIFYYFKGEGILQYSEQDLTYSGNM